MLCCGQSTPPPPSPNSASSTQSRAPLQKFCLQPLTDGLGAVQPQSWPKSCRTRSNLPERLLDQTATSDCTPPACVHDTETQRQRDSRKRNLRRSSSSKLPLPWLHDFWVSAPALSTAGQHPNVRTPADPTVALLYNVWLPTAFKGQPVGRTGSIYSLGGPASLQPSLLPIFIRAAVIPNPKHAVVPVM